MPDNKQTPWWKKGLENQPLASFSQALKAPTVQGLLGAKASSVVNKPVEKNAVSAGMKKALQAIDKATGGAWRDAPDSKKVWKYLYLKDQKGGITPEHVGKATTAILQAREAALKTDVTQAERVKYGTAVKPEVKDLGLQNATVNGEQLDTQGVIDLLKNPPADRNMIPVAKINGKDVSYTKFYDIVKRRSGMLPERWAQAWESEVKYRNQADEVKLNADVTKAANPQRTLLGNVAEAGVHFTENPLASMGVEGNPLTWARTAVGGVARAKGNADIEAAIAEVEKEEGRKFSPEEKAAVFAQMEGILSNKQSVAEYGTDALSLLVPMGSMSAAGRLARGAELGTASKLLSKVPTNTGQIANKILASKVGEIPLLARGVTAASKAVPDFVTTPFLAQQGAKGLDALGALSGDENSLERTGQLLESLKNPVNLALTSLGIYGGISAYRHNASVLKAGTAERALAKDAPIIQKRMEHIQAIGGAMGINGKTASQIAKETGVPIVDVKQVLATLSEGEGAVFEKTGNGRYRASRVTPVEPVAPAPKGSSATALEQAMRTHGGFSELQVKALLAGLNPILEKHPGLAVQVVRNIDPKAADELFQSYSDFIYKASGILHMKDAPQTASTETWLKFLRKYVSEDELAHSGLGDYLSPSATDLVDGTTRRVNVNDLREFMENRSIDLTVYDSKLDPNYHADSARREYNDAMHALGVARINYNTVLGNINRTDEDLHRVSDVLTSAYERAALATDAYHGNGVDLQAKYGDMVIRDTPVDGYIVIGASEPGWGRGGHFDTPDGKAQIHVRAHEDALATGEKVLYVNEIQSDSRKSGRWESNWRELGIKITLRHAIEHGYDVISIPSTAEAVSRIEKWPEGSTIKGVTDNYTSGVQKSLRKMGVKHEQGMIAGDGVLDDAQRMVTVVRITPEIRAKYGGPLELFQGNKGAYNPVTRVLSLGNGADVSTVIHEVGHDWHKFLQNHPEHGPIIQQTYGEVGAGNRKGSELFTRHLEQFMRTGNSPAPALNPVFEAISTWMRDIYKKIVKAGDPRISDEVKAIFEKELGDISPETARYIEEFNAELANKATPTPRTGALADDASRNTPTEVEAPQIALLPDGLPHPEEFTKNAGDIGFLERAKAANLAALEAARERAKSNVIPTPRGKGRSGAKVSYTKELEVLFRVGIDHAFDLAIEMGGIAHVTYTKWAERVKPSVPEGVSMPGLWRVVRKRIGLPSGAEKSTVQSVLQTVSGKNIDTDAISKFLGYDIVKGKSLTLEQMEAAGARLERAIGKEQFGSVVDSIVAKASVPGTTLSTEDQVSLIYGMRRQADIVRKATKDALEGGVTEMKAYTEADKKLQEIMEANRAVGTAASSAFRARRLELTAKDRAVRHKLQIKTKLKRQLKPEEAKAVDDIYDALEHTNAEVKSAMSKRAYKAMSNYVEYKGKMPGEELQTAEQAATLERLRKEYLESVNKTHIGAIEAIPKGMRYVTNILWEKLRGGSTLERAVSTAIDEAYSIGIHLDEEDILAEFVARGLDSGSYEAAVAAQKLHEAELIRTGQATQGIIDTVSMRVDGQRFNYGFREATGGVDQPEGAPRVIERSAQAMQGAEHNIRGDVPLGARIEIREKVRQMTDAQFLALLQKKGLTLAQIQQPLLFAGKVDPETGQVYKERIVVETTPEQAEALKLFQAKINAVRKRANLEADLPPFIAEEIAQGADPELIKMLEGLDIKSADVDDLAPILNMFRKRKKLLDMDTDEVLRNRANSPEMTPEAKAIFDKMAKEIKDLQALRNTEMRISKLVMDGKLDPDIAKAMTIEEAKAYADNVDKIERINKDIELIESGKKDLKSGPENAKFIDEQVWGALEHRRKVISNMRNIERDLTHKEMLRMVSSIKEGKVWDSIRGAGRYIYHTGDLGMDFIRSSVASLDMSALFTQGGKAFLNPFFFKPWAEAAYKSGGALMSEHSALKTQTALEQTRSWVIGEQAGLHIRKDSDILSREMGEDIFSESAMNWILHQGNKASLTKPGTWLAGLGGLYARPIIASSRSMDVFSNSIRLRIFEQMAGGPEALAKIKPGSDMERLKEIAEFVNNITGRATGKNYAKLAATLNKVLFSGNYTLSAPQAYLQQPGKALKGMAMDAAEAIHTGSWTPIRQKAKLHAARVGAVVMPITMMAIIGQALEMSGAGYLDTNRNSSKFLKFRYWGSGDPNEGITVDLQPQLGQWMRTILMGTNEYGETDPGTRYYDEGVMRNTPLKQKVDADATRLTDEYKAYIADMRRRTGDPTYDIFDEDGNTVRRWDKSRLQVAYQPIEINRFPNSEGPLEKIAKVMFVWKFNPVSKYMTETTQKLLQRGNIDSKPLGWNKDPLDTVLPLRDALPIGVQNAWDAVDRASGEKVQIDEFDQTFGKMSLTPEARSVANGQTISMLIVNMLAMNASSDINEGVNWHLQDLRRAAEMWRKIKSGEVNDSTPEGRQKILEFRYYWKDNAVYQKEYRDAAKNLQKALDKIKKDASPEAKKEKKEPGRADLLAP